MSSRPAPALSDAASSAAAAVAPRNAWPSDAFVPLRDRGAEWDARLEMIASARQFLYVTSYFLEHDAHGLRFLDALQAAARRGVAVFLGLDDFGQRLGNYARPARERQQLDARLRSAQSDGVQIGWYRAPTALQRRLGAGHHVKFQLSEAGRLLVGSSNLSTRSFDGWDEFSAVLDGAIVARVLRDVMDLFGLDGDAHRRHLAVLDQHAAATDATLAPAHRFDYLIHDPNAGASWWHPLLLARNPITDRLIDAIDTAQRSVRLSSFHCKPTPALADALVRAALRGVHVELFHSHRAALPESELPWLSAAFDYQRFLGAGIRIHESRRGEHSKLFVVDDRWAAFGSYNAEHAAHERLVEMLLISEDARVVREIDAVLDQMAAAADVHRVTRPHGRDGWRGELGWLLWRPLRRWL